MIVIYLFYLKGLPMQYNSVPKAGQYDSVASANTPPKPVCLLLFYIVFYVLIEYIFKNRVFNT